MRFHAVPFRMTLVALAASALLAACGGGGEASPPRDIIPPTLAISDNVPATTAAGPVTFTFTFSEPVSGFDASDIVVSGGTAGEFTMGATNRSATLVVTPGANTTGTLQVSVAAGRFTDFARNANTSGASASQAFDTRGVTPPPPPPVTNLLANGSFSSGATGWSGNALNVVTEGGNSFNLANVATAGNAFDANLSYALPIPTQGVRYRLTFTASSNRNRTLVAGIGLAGAPFTAVVETVNLTTSPQTIVRELTANFASNDSRVIFDMGADTGTVVIDDVVLEVIPSVAPGGPSTAAQAPVARQASDVRSIFSDSFTNLANVNFNPDFGPNARIEDAVIGGNNTKFIDIASGQVFGGISFTSSKFDATGFTHFSMDYWVADPALPGQALDIKLSNHDGVDSETSAIQFTVAPVVGGTWQRLNIPLANFGPASAPANLSRNAIAQIVVTAARADVGQPVRVYFDNMHFYR